MNNDIRFSDQALALVKNIMTRYPEGKHKSALLPVLHIAQAEFGGWLSAPTMDYVASVIGIKPIEVYEVASFYTMFNLKPVGKCVIEICRTGPCWLVGADDIVKYFEQKLGIEVGETTADGMFTIKTVECLAACGFGPVCQIGQTYHENLTTESVDVLIEYHRAHTHEPISHWDKSHI